MIKRLREVLDVARAMLRRRRRDFVFVSGSPGSCIEGMEPFDPIRDRDKPANMPERRTYGRIEVTRAQLGEASPGLIAAIDAQIAQSIAAHHAWLAEQLLVPGLAPCPTCATMQQPRDGHMAVHFASATAQRPCVGSWPAGKAAA